MTTDERREKMLITGLIFVAIGLGIIATWIKGD